MTNPLLSESSLPYGLPDFAAISLKHVIPAVEVGIDQQRAEIAEICVAENTWENTVEALERSGAILRRATAWFFNLQGTDATEEFEEVAAHIVPQLAAHRDEIYQNQELYQRILQVEVPGDEESQRLHAHFLRAFRRRGAELTAGDQERLRDINQRLAVLADDFGRTLLKDTRERALHLKSARDLDGLSKEALAAARTATGYTLHLELPTVQSALEDLKSKRIRRRLWEASRGRRATLPILLEEVRLRAERARLLGYDTHGDYVIEEETAASLADVERMLHELAPAAAANANVEFKAAQDLAGEDIEAADWPYWNARRAEQEVQVDTAELSRYFSLERVLVDGAFYAAKLLYGIEVTRREDLRGYRDDVAVWEVSEEGKGLGLLLTDYSARESKRGGAWMSSFSDQSELLGSYPVVVNVMSVSSPLLSIDEVRTVFHEFGHALHGLLSQVRYPTFSGTNVPRDWVEFPSQFNENWAFEPLIARNYARHVDTDEVISEEQLAQVTELNCFGQGLATAEYLAAAIIDLAWHSLSPEEAQKITTFAEVEQLERNVLERAGLDVDKLAPRYSSTYFNHIFGGGYSAGYYSYLWAEALDADIFEWMKDFTDDTAELRAAGERMRALILSRGGASDYEEAFMRLRGRAREVSALLARRGLSGIEVA